MKNNYFLITFLVIILFSPKFSISQQIVNPEEAQTIQENKGIGKPSNINVVGFISVWIKKATP